MEKADKSCAGMSSKWIWTCVWTLVRDPEILAHETTLAAFYKSINNSFRCMQFYGPLSSINLYNFCLCSSSFDILWKKKILFLSPILINLQGEKFFTNYVDVRQSIDETSIFLSFFCAWIFFHISLHPEFIFLKKNHLDFRAIDW